MIFNREGTVQYTASTQKTPQSTMWHWTNILNNKKERESKKLDTLKKMATNFDDTTRHLFLAALQSVLRDEHSAKVREIAIRMLGDHFTWCEIEWTFWLHEERSRKRKWHGDQSVLAQVTLYSQANARLAQMKQDFTTIDIVNALNFARLVQAVG